MNPSSRIPVALSAFLCPGLGQLVQQRWAVGAVLATGFLVGFCWVMALALGNIADYYSLVINPDANPEVTQPSAFTLPCCIAGLFYLVSLFDVVAAQHRKARELSDEEFRKAMLEEKSAD